VRRPLRAFRETAPLGYIHQEGLSLFAAALEMPNSLTIPEGLNPGVAGNRSPAKTA